MSIQDPKKELLEHLPAMRAFARSLTMNHAAADDLVQDTIVKAWSNLDKYQPGTNLKAWLFTILRNTFYSSIRKRKWEVEDVDDAQAALLSEKPAHDGVLALQEFREAFRQLPEDQREVLVLVGASGFSYEEAAEMCGCAGGTVKSRASRARKRLSELLELEDGESHGADDPKSLAVIANLAP